MIKKCSYYCGTSILLWLVCVFAAVAQQPLRSGYFLDGFYYRHQFVFISVSGRPSDYFSE